MRGKNPAVLAVEMLNPYNGIDASHNERHLIRDVQGQPLRRGVYVDSIYDIGRIENVHFNPWWSMKPALFSWQQAAWRGLYLRPQRLAVCVQHVLFRLQHRLQVHPNQSRASATATSSGLAPTTASRRCWSRIRREWAC